MTARRTAFSSRFQLRRVPKTLLASCFACFCLDKCMRKVPPHPFGMYASGGPCEIPVHITDLTTKNMWDAVREQIQTAGSLCVRPDVGVPEDETLSCLFTPVFTNEYSDDIVCHVFVVSFGTDFNEDDFQAIREWQGRYPDKSYLIIVLIRTKRTWMFAGQRPKALKALENLMPGSLFCLAKCPAHERQPCSEGELKGIVAGLETAISNEYTRKMKREKALRANCAKMGVEVAKEICDLAELFRSFGYFRRSLDLYRSMMKVDGMVFWPESPAMIDVRGRERKMTSGFEIMAVAVNGIIRSAEAMRLPKDAVDNTLEAFALVLNYAETVEQKVFACIWIKFVAGIVGEVVLPIDTEGNHCNQLVLTACIGLYRLTSLSFDISNPFFANVSEDTRRDLSSKESILSLFGAEWERAKILYDDYTKHKEILDTMALTVFTGKNDKLAQSVLARLTEGLHTTPHKLNVSMVEYMFHNVEHLKVDTAKILLTSSVCDEKKREALDFLMTKDIEINCAVGLREVIRCPAFFRRHEVFTEVPFAVVLTIPSFLWGYEASLLAQFTGRECDNSVLRTAQCVRTLEANMAVECVVVCSAVGDFDTITLCLRVNNLQITWSCALTTHLIVVESVLPHALRLKVPCFASSGSQRPVVLVCDSIDSSVVEVEICVSVPGLIEIRYVDHSGGSYVFRGDDLVKITKFKKLVELVIIYDTIDQVPIEIDASATLIWKDGSVSTISRTFELPLQREIEIRLMKQTLKHQQFQIVNESLGYASFDYDGSRREIRPRSTCSLLRDVTQAELKVCFFEKGWEEFPVVFVWRELPTELEKVKLTFDNRRWSVGDPLLVTTNPPSFPVEDDQWICTSLDVTGCRHVFIPKIPGVLRLPKFNLGRRACDADPVYVDIEPRQFPYFVNMEIRDLVNEE